VKNKEKSAYLVWSLNKLLKEIGVISDYIAYL
jgi:hypothetical protein